MRSRPAAAAVAAACGLGALLHLTGATAGLEQDTRALRFAERPERAAPDVAVVAVDGASLARLRSPWPLRRSLHAKAIDTLDRLGARTIVYDVQFTEPTVEREDVALFDAVQRAGGVVLATTESDGRGGHGVLGGPEVVRDARASVGAGNFPTDGSDVVERLPERIDGLDSLAVAAVRAAGRPLPPGAFGRDGWAYIAFPGDPGTVRTHRFSDLLDGRVPAAAVRGKVVVVGVSAATEQDVHPTPAGDRLMSGPEIQAAAIQTALDGLPLRSAPAWADLLAVLLLAALPVLAARRLGVAGAVGAAGAAVVAWLLLAFALFRGDVVVAVAAPVLAALIGAASGIAASWAVERRARQARTEELHATQLELVARLAKAAESRDEDTGEHIERIGRMTERLALAIGWAPEAAAELGHAAALHDVGKIAIPDRVLLKPGKLDPEEWRLMQSHAELGAEVLAGSPSPVLQVAERIARTHHERWDGTGYPAGLAGEGIPIEGRIVAVCDVFDALTSRRPYKEPWPVQDALDELRRGAGTHFDPRLVEAFLAHVAPPVDDREAVPVVPPPAVPA